MKVTVDKNVLNQFLEMIAENYLPGDDDMDKFAFEEEPIKAIDMMATQLATEKPDVADEDYRPASISGLSAAAAVIAEEVPPDMIDMFYDGLHRLLDTVYDSHTTKQLQESISSSQGSLDSVAVEIRDLKRRTVGKIKELSSMGIPESEIDNYKSLLTFMFAEPKDEVQKLQFARDLVNYAISEDKQVQSVVFQIQQQMNLDRASLVEELAKILKDDEAVEIETSVSSQTVVDDLEVAEFASNFFQAVLTGLPFDTSDPTSLSDNQIAEVTDDVSETIAKLTQVPTINIAGSEVPSQALAMLLQVELDQFLQSIELSFDDTVESEIDDMSDEEELPKPIDDAEEEKKTFTELKDFLGFSGVSGARQWYKKHVENKFVTLLKTMVNLDTADPGAKAFYGIFSDSYKQILRKMADSISIFQKSYALPPGSHQELAMKKLVSDLSEMSNLVEPLEHILSGAEDGEAIVKIMNSHIGKAVAAANSDSIKVATTFIMDKAAPAIVEDVMTRLYPQIPAGVVKKLQEHISGKSNRPFTEKETQEGVPKTATKKFIKLGIDQAGYNQIVEEYLEELDEVIENVMLPPDVAKQLYGDKYDKIMAKDPAISSIYKKVTKKADLKEKDILDLMHEALVEYATDLNPDMNESTSSRMNKYKLLSELINQCL